MSLTFYSLLRNRRGLVLTLSLIALASWLAIPGRHLTWILPSASAIKTSADDEMSRVSESALLTSGAVSFGAPTFNVNEGAGSASITLTRTGGSAGALSAKVTLADVTTSPADYIFSPGSLDPTFITPPQVDAGLAGTYAYPTMALQPDGKLLLGQAGAFWRLNTDGSIDTTFAKGTMNGGVGIVALQPDGKIIIAGGFTTINNLRVNHMARLNSDGSLDPTFDVGTGPNESVSVIIVQPDGKLLISGYFMSFNGVSTGYQQVVRLNSDGSIDNSFTRSGIPGLAIALQPDGKFLGGGSGGIKRGNADGTIDTTFNAQFSGTYPYVWNIVVQPDGKIIIAGVFDHVGGQVAYGLARLNADGSFDPTFNTGTGADSNPSGLALQPDGKVLIGGSFTSFNGTSVNSLARLNADGSLDTTFVSNVLPTFGSQSSINNILIQADGKVFIRGYLTVSGSNVTNRYLARLRNDLFATWESGDTTNKTVRLPIVDDLLDEQDETLNLTLTPLTSGASAGTNSNAVLTITDNDEPPTITSAPPPAFVNVNTAYSHTFTATGSPAPTFSVTSGNLPPGINLSPSGTLSGSAFFGGAYNITVTASNGVGPAATQTFSIKVNAAPSSGTDTYGAIQNTTLTVPAPGVLHNDIDPDGDALTATLVSNPTLGTVTLNSDGSFVYIPNFNASGFDTFTYRVSDGNLNGNITSVFIAVNSGGTLQFSSSSYSRLEDSGSATITVTRTGGNFGEVRVNYSTSDGTATAGSDYTAVSGTLIFANGVTTQTFNIPLISDTINEPNETVKLTLANAQGTGTLGLTSEAVLNIFNDDNPTLQFSQASYAVSEGARSINIIVTRSGDKSASATVKYATSDSTNVNFGCNPNTPAQPTGIASRKCDYHIGVGALRFAAGEDTKQFTLSIIDDVYTEGPEAFTLTLGNPVGAVMGQNRQVPINITDDDTPAAANPIDQTRFFVRQLYVDLLSREPDPAGWNGWTSRIDQCGQPGQPPPPCDRVTVAGDGFLRSGEFFDRQFFVLRLYRTGLGRILRYDEVGDLAYVSGFLTDAELELNKQDLVTEFVARAEFANRYNPLSNAGFVSTLLVTAGVTVPQAIQDDWVLKLDTNQKTRAQVFREISERPEVSNKYAHEAQVVSAYYGFFSRNPDGAYLNFLQRLDSGEITLGDLANAFVNAAEYRQRFGQ